MARGRAVGLAVLIASLIGIAVYTYLLFCTPEPIQLLTLKLTAYVAAIAALGLLAWVGYTLATTPPPKTLEEIEKELEEDIKKLKETK